MLMTDTRDEKSATSVISKPELEPSPNPDPNPDRTQTEPEILWAPKTVCGVQILNLEKKNASTSK